MPIHLKGSAVCASLRLEQQSCCSNSNMQIVTQKCDSVFHLLLDFGSEWKTPGGPLGLLLSLKGLSSQRAGGAQVWLVISAVQLRIQNEGNTIQ